MKLLKLESVSVAVVGGLPFRARCTPRLDRGSPASLGRFWPRPVPSTRSTPRREHRPIRASAACCPSRCPRQSTASVGLSRPSEPLAKTGGASRLERTTAASGAAQTHHRGRRHLLPRGRGGGRSVDDDLLSLEPPPTTTTSGAVTSAKELVATSGQRPVSSMTGPASSATNTTSLHANQHLKRPDDVQGDESRIQHKRDLHGLFPSLSSMDRAAHAGTRTRSACTRFGSTATRDLDLLQLVVNVRFQGR
jgi:hypothetical protein